MRLRHRIHVVICSSGQVRCTSDMSLVQFVTQMIIVNFGQQFGPHVGPAPRLVHIVAHMVIEERRKRFGPGQMSHFGLVQIVTLMVIGKGGQRNGPASRYGGGPNHCTVCYRKMNATIWTRRRGWSRSLHLWL